MKTRNLRENDYNTYLSELFANRSKITIRDPKWLGVREKDAVIELTVNFTIKEWVMIRKKDLWTSLILDVENYIQKVTNICVSFPYADGFDQPVKDGIKTLSFAFVVPKPFAELYLGQNLPKFRYSIEKIAPPIPRSFPLKRVI